MTNLQKIKENYFSDLEGCEAAWETVEQQLRSYNEDELDNILTMMENGDEELHKDKMRTEKVILADNINLFNTVMQQYQTQNNSNTRGNSMPPKKRTPSGQRNTILGECYPSTPPKPITITEQNSQFKKEELEEIITLIRENKSVLATGDGGDDFITFRKSQLYVDKSMLIEEVIELKTPIFISAPQRWGKSLNLSMIKAFFQPDGDDPARYTDKTIASGKYDFDGNIAGRVNDPEINQEYKGQYKGANKNLIYFTGGKVVVNKDLKRSKTLDSLNIAKQTETKDDYLNLQGKHPVIYLNFKDINGKSDQDIERNSSEISIENITAQLRTAVSKAFKEHKYLYEKLLLQTVMNYNRLYPNQTITFQGQDICFLEMAVFDSGKINPSEDLQKLKAYHKGKASDEAPLEESIGFLTSLLYEHYEREVYILVDEFDKPVYPFLELFFSGKDAKKALSNVKEVAKLTSKIVGSTAKGPKNTRIILTGILNTVDLSASATLNKLRDKVLMNGEFTSYFGFSETEVQKQILQEIIPNDPNIRTQLYNKLKFWYNGYNIGTRQGLFTPSSVMTYLLSLADHKKGDTSPKLESAWLDTMTNNFIEQIAEYGDISGDFMDKLTRLAIGEQVQLNKVDSKLNALIKEDGTAELENLVTYLLILSGYVTKADGGPNLYQLPAREVQKAYTRYILKPWIQKTLKIDDKGLTNLIKSFLQSVDNFNAYKEFIEKEIVDRINNHSNRESFKNFKEADFQLLLGGLFNLALLSNDQNAKYFLCSERVNELGKRLDALFLPIEGKGVSAVIIHEYKAIAATRVVTKEQKLENATWQIYAKRYLEAPLSLIYQNYKSDSEWTTLKQNSDYNHLTHIYTRPIAFFKGRKKWSFEIAEHQHNLEQAHSIDKHFQDKISGNNALMSNLSGGESVEDVNSARSAFLESLGLKDCNSLNKLLEKYEEKPVVDNMGEQKNEPKAKNTVGKKNKRKGNAGMSEGLSDEEVRDKLLEYSDELRRREGISLQTEILTIDAVLYQINRWHFNNVNHGFIGMVKLNDISQESSHAVLVYAKRNDFDRNTGVVFQIVDPFDEWTARKYFADDRETLLNSLKDGPKLFSNLFGQIKTEVSVKYLEKQRIDESNCVQLCLDEIKKEVMHSRLQEMANCTNNTTVLLPVEEIWNEDTLGKIQDTLISFHRSGESRHRIILPLFNDNKWHVMVLDLQRSKAIIDALHYSTIALPDRLRRALPEMLNTALEGAIFFKPLQRIMGPNGPVTPPRINIPDYAIKIKEEYDSTITDTKKLTDQICIQITGRYMLPNQTNSGSYFGRSSTNYPANISSLFWGKQDNLRIANNSEPRMDIERKCEVPANSIFGTRSTNIFGSNPNSSSRFPSQSNESLVKSGIQEQRGFFGNSWARPQLSSESKFFKN